MKCTAVLAIIVSIFAGCVRWANQGDQEEVVERSRPSRPAWVALPTSILHEADAMLRFVELRAGLLDLPLGIKQVQLGALASSRDALRNLVQDRLARLAKGAGLSLSDAMEGLDRLVQEAVANVHGREAKIADFYFEKLQSEVKPEAEAPSAEYYRVYVLVEIPKTTADQLWDHIGQKLTGSSQAELRRLGQLVSESGEGQAS